MSTPNPAPACVYCGRVPRQLEADEKNCRGCNAPRWMQRPFTKRRGRTVIYQTTDTYLGLAYMPPVFVSEEFTYWGVSKSTWELANHD